MAEQLARHSLMDITLKAAGDLHIDAHHTTEDTGWAIGEALNKALATELVLPAAHTLSMDDLSTVALIFRADRFWYGRLNCLLKCLVQETGYSENGFRPLRWRR